ncbi:response regulator [Duganella levis]|uniref:Response regulator n=1 Tax=Duganella levis TaxID=2692169 RepID=A0ABW9W595_9BURK|nr:response regulator [Duganella levis]MYN29192.1 response regulator [Duganella levis]
MMKKILIIDDNIDSAQALAAILEMIGHRAEIAHGAVCGLTAVITFQPDIVFLDIGMPEMDGYQVAARIRADTTMLQPFLIAFTAWDDVKSLARSAKAGFDRHIAKTSSFETLVCAITEATR